MDVHNRANVGYAFINFLKHKDMVRFTEMFTDYVFQKHPSLKIARVSPAHIQGLIENLRHFSSRAVTWARNGQYRPIVKYEGRQRDLCELLAELPASGSVDNTFEVADSTVSFNLAAPEFTPESCEWSMSFNPDATEFCPMADMLQYAEGYDCTGSASTSFNPEAPEFVPEASLESIMSHCLDDSPMTGVEDMPPGLEEILSEEAWVASEKAEPRTSFSRVVTPPGLTSPALTAFGDSAPLPCDAAAVSRHGTSASIYGAAGQSFSAARAGLQEAVSKWLQSEQRLEGAPTSSAAGDSSTRGSSNPSPRTRLDAGLAGSVGFEAEGTAETA
jgi:hypothetical protein